MIKKVINKIVVEIEINQVPAGWFCEAEKLGVMKTPSGKVQILTGIKSKSLLFEFPDGTRYFIENKDVCRKVIMVVLNQEPEDET
jgi:hypothetical protein